MKAALTAVSVPIVTAHGAVPVQPPPDHEVKVPLIGAAVRFTWLPIG